MLILCTVSEVEVYTREETMIVCCFCCAGPFAFAIMKNKQRLCHSIGLLLEQIIVEYSICTVNVRIDRMAMEFIFNLYISSNAEIA